MTGHIAKISAQKKNNVFLLQGKTNIGVDCYHYVLVKSAMINRFKKLAAGVPVNIEDYGTVIHKGYGAPSEHLKKMILDKYS